MSYRTAYLTLAWGAGLIVLGCGGGAESRGSSASDVPDPYAASSGNPAVLSSSEFTSALNESTMASNAPASTEFLPDTGQIFLLAKIENLPDHSQIEVQWLRTVSPDTPIYISRTAGSGTHTFFSKLRPGKEELDEGNYRVLIMVNGAKVGDLGFRVVNRRGGGMTRVKELSVTTAIEVDTNKPIKKMTTFPRGIKKVYASFFVGGLETGNTIRVIWLKDDNAVHEEDIECEGAKYYSAVYSGNKGLSNGDWGVDIHINGEVFASRSFFVGDDSSGPVIEQAALGTKLGKNRMPKKPTTSFKQGTGEISCGLRFLSLPDDSKVDIEWISMVGGSETPLKTTTTTVEKGGAPSVGMTWRPGKIEPGPYKAAIYVNSTKIHELAFEVE
jgi:hypothetical protein